MSSAEYTRLLGDDVEAWRRWGPYLAERAWGTVREDYSADGDAWNYFPHDHARSRVYRWNEDGLGGISDDKSRLCFALALWNGNDPILKERLFGLTNPQGNHGEDVKECYYYLDSTPTHSFMRMLYKYPQARFPYEQLLEENARRSKDDPEYELPDTGVFADNRYFDILIEYAKAGANDILIRITATNRGSDTARLHLLPTLWFRNTWGWGDPVEHPQIRAGSGALYTSHEVLGEYRLEYAPGENGALSVLFTENETNTERLFNTANTTPFVKDAFHRWLVDGEHGAVNPAQVGTKAALCYTLDLAAGAAGTVCLRLSALPATPAPTQNAASAAATDAPVRGASAPQPHELGEPASQPGDTAAPQGSNTTPPDPWSDFAGIFAQRQHEADSFYTSLLPEPTNAEQTLVFRQAMAGLLWCKQFYHYQVRRWLEGDPGQPTPPPERRTGRNHEWQHLYNERVMSMPDSWEYPWYAAWDLAFHCITLALIDPDFAKNQLDHMLREWYQHPNGQLPAYEWKFSDVNPPVTAWAAWRVYKIEQKHWGRSDRAFLERVFHKLLLNFTWWVNRKDDEGNNVFSGGFLGLDNIGVFDRSAELPDGGHLEQSDGTSWMGMFCLDMLTIALELARENPVYEAIATKFFEHFLAIADALNNLGGTGIPLWNEDDEFFYDVIHLPDGSSVPLRVYSFVGLIPLFAVRTIEPELIKDLPEFRERMLWYLKNRPELAQLVSRWQEPGVGERRLMALCRGYRMKRLLQRALDPAEFLGDYGVRSLSRYHAEHPYVFDTQGREYSVRYEPGESRTGMFGGNSNWRGPIWFPVNYLLIESLQRYHHYYGEDFKVECPTGSGQFLTLEEVANELSQRLIRLFLPGADGKRPGDGGDTLHEPEGLLFHEYFHGDSGKGLGASHQTGWTALVAKLIYQQNGGINEVLDEGAPLATDKQGQVQSTTSAAT